MNDKNEILVALREYRTALQLMCEVNSKKRTGRKRLFCAPNGHCQVTISRGMKGYKDHVLYDGHNTEEAVDVYCDA